MRFSLLLLILRWKLTRAANKHPSFRERLRERDFTLQIKTRDESRGRYFVFSDGELFSRAGVHTHPDVALIWADPTVGFETMRAGDRQASLEAKTRGLLVITGDPSLALWFTETVALMRHPDAAGQRSAPQQKIAFIGLGNMGAGIARSLMRAGFRLTVYNRTASKMQPFVEAGATAARSPREAAADADIVITSLMGDDSVWSVVEGETGLLAGMKPGAIHIGASTVSPDCATRLAKRHAEQGKHYLSAPVLGRPDVAEAGQLITFVAGDAAAIDACSPVFEAYTRMVRKLPGEQRIANVTKLCANYAAAAVIELMGQIYAFADKNGVELGMVEDLFQSTWAHPGLKEYATNIRLRNFDSEGGFSMSGGLKDVELMISAAQAAGAQLDYAPIIREKMLECMENGLGDKDWSGTYEITRRHAGL